LSEIGSVLSSEDVVLLMGCNAGKGFQGSDLLIELSKIWANRKVVGFTKVMAFGWARMRLGEFCSEPGYRETNEEIECKGTPKERIM
jgi:hypothetical protein